MAGRRGFPNIHLVRDALGVLVPATEGAADDVMESPAAREAFGVGRQRAQRELSAPPLKRAGLLRRLWYRLLRAWADFRKHEHALEAAQLYRLQRGKVMFRCPICCQGLRLPTRASVTATCPRCEAEVACET